MNTSPSQPPSATQSITILDIVLIIAKRIRFIILFTALSAVFIALYSVFTIIAPPNHPLNKLPTVYTPTVTVRLQESSGSSLGNLGGGGDSSGLGLLGSLAGVSAGPNNADLAQALVKGSTLIDQVTTSHNFVSHFGIKDLIKTSSRKVFLDSLIIEYEASSGLLTLGYTDIDPVFATEVLQTTLKVLNSDFKNLTTDGVIKRKRFLEDRLEETSKELSLAQNNLITFQEENNIINFEIQTQQQIQNILAVNSTIIEKQMQLLQLKEIRSSQDPQIIRLENEIKNSRDYLTYLKTGFNEFDAVGIPQEQLPTISVEYARLESELAIAKALYELIRQQYEMVKIEEADNTKLFQIVHNAEIPEIKSAPSRGKICIIFTIAMGFLALFFAFLLEYFSSVKASPVENEKWNTIKGYLSLKRSVKSKKG